VKRYYDARAAEYDDWYLGVGLFARRHRGGWQEDLDQLQLDISALPVTSTLDVACGTGFLTRHLRGPLTILDQSERMLAIARRRVPQAACVQHDALALPFDDDAFARVFTAHFYGHLEPGRREQFVAEARRVAPELVVVDSAIRPEHDPEEWQPRTLNDSSRHIVYKRYFDPGGLAGELGGGEVLHASRWFVMVRSVRSHPGG
jgi:ubiquinone/menaquinone biosynthesis C-methylase UbiE